MTERPVFRVVLPEDQVPGRVDKILAARMPDATRETIKRWINEERVLVNGRPCRPRDRVGPGSEVIVRPGPLPIASATPDPSVPIDVMFEDEDVLVVFKPAGLVVHPGRGNWTGTLVNGLLALPGFRRPPADDRDPEGHLRPGIVHRLDKDTSGVLVVAKSSRAREGLKAQLQEHSMERVYHALTWGVPRSGRIETWHGRDPRSRIRFSSLVDAGKVAITHVRVVEPLAGGRAAHVECRLETGRTHQIRVHLSQQCRTPLILDALYGGQGRDGERSTPDLPLARHALHAAVLGFVHPTSRRELRFERPMPDDMRLTLECLRGA